MSKMFKLTSLCGFLILAATANATEISIPAYADAEIDYAGALGLTVRTSEPDIQTSRSGPNNIHKGVYLFNLDSVPENWTPRFAEFEVTINQAIANTSAEAPVEFYGFPSNGSVEIEDFDSPSASPGALLQMETFQTGTSGPEPHTQLTIDFANIDPILDALDRDNELMIRSETINFATFRIHSLENTDGYGVPTLTLSIFADADFNNDDAVDCTDVDGLVAEISAGTNDQEFDLTGDGYVDTDDLDEWRSQAGAINLASGNPYQEGDANLDGSVDVSDFALWNANKFTNTPRWCAGDFSADGVVDVSDFSLWNANKFSSADAAVSSVPEPHACWMMLLGVVGLVRRVGRYRGAERR